VKADRELEAQRMAYQLKVAQERYGFTVIVGGYRAPEECVKLQATRINVTEVVDLGDDPEFWMHPSPRPIPAGPIEIEF